MCVIVVAASVFCVIDSTLQGDEGVALVGVPDPRVVLPVAAMSCWGGVEGKEKCLCVCVWEGGGGILRHLQQLELHCTKVRAQRGGETSGTCTHTMSVLIATQLKIDTGAPSRRVRGPFSMHGTMRGNVCVLWASLPLQADKAAGSL